ncbi:MAG TPA: glycosyltransferase family 39 protein [Acidobacteriaceae bacterium]|nr:glycosyltransferase family 39 protein [Acidobacteriaceae bacterium]
MRLNDLPEKRTFQGKKAVSAPPLTLGISRSGWLLLLLLAGAALRLWFIHSFPLIDGDSLLYGDIAKNWLSHGIYGRSLYGDAGRTIQPTLARLPGYPAFLAVCFYIFGLENYRAVLYVQGFLDLLSCLLISGFVLQVCGRRAAGIALLLTALCPFTASYAATPLAETPSIFCIALGFYSLAAFLRRPRTWRLVPLVFSWSFAALLRPEGALLAVVLCISLVFGGWRSLGGTRTLRLAAACVFFSVLPFVPWTLRNAATFHVFQPLVGRSATDPGEFTAPGFDLWMKSWAVDFTATSEIYWNAGSDKLDIRALPSRAFDNPEQYRQTAALLADYNRTTTITPEMDARFASLAAERTHHHPLRSYIALPVLRLADMWLRPRLELLDVPLRWWQYGLHPAATWFALFYGALNLFYLAAAIPGALRWPRPPESLLSAMLGLIALRSLLLATLAAPETRYTVECLPLVMALAAAGLAGTTPTQTNRQDRAQVAAPHTLPA